jgi:uncharacterized protein YndB with AHSA1/START domain
MSQAERAEISILGDEAQARFVRSFDHPPQALWAALTTPARLLEWLAPGEIEQAIGGRVKLDFVDSGIVIDSAVSALVRGRLLEYSWGGPGDPLRPVRWELVPAQAGTRLELTLSLPASDDIARSCAGWDAHLEMLAASLEGVPIKFPFEHFKAAREAYKASLGQVAA